MAEPGGADSGRDYNAALSGAETELAPSSSETAAHTAWALDDGPDWKPPFWTAGKITAVAVGAAVLAAIIVAGFVGYHLQPDPPAAAPAPVTSSAEPTEPTAERTPAPRAAPPSAEPAPLPPRSTAPRPPAPVALSASGGSAWVGTQSGRTACQITAGSVICLVEFAVRTPIRYGAPANGVSVSITGDFDWTIGDRGQQPVETMRYDTTYRALGWTITPTSDGTTFINDTTGHGMTVSVEGVQPF